MWKVFQYLHDLNISFSIRCLGVIILLICFNTILLSQEQKENQILKSDAIKYLDGKPYYMHEVKKDQTLYSISNKYRVSINSLKKFNLNLTTTIFIRQIIKIPVHTGNLSIITFEEAKKDKKNKRQKKATHSTNLDGPIYSIALINNQKKKELTPGSTFNLVVMLKNNSDTEETFHLKTKIPEGWNQLTDYSSVIVYGNSKKLKILSFNIMESTKVGNYIIEIQAIGKTENSKIGNVKIPVYVKPRFEILTKLIEAPKYAFSGDSVNVKFLIHNLSNIKATINATISNKDAKETRTFILAPDSLVFTNVSVSTTKNIVHYKRNSVSLTSSIAENPETKKTVSYTFDVIPSEKIKFDAHNRIPVKISGLLVTNNQLGDRKYGAMFDIKGSGIISKRKNRNIDFHFLGPNQQGNPVLGQTDEYNVNYSSIHSDVILGDNSYSLTNLTEGSRNGRGFGYTYKFNKLSIGSFVNYPRFYPKIKQVISAFGNYFSGKNLQIKAGFLNKTFVSDSTAQLYTISGKASPFIWSDFEFEYAAGMTAGIMTMAYSTALKINFKLYKMFFNFTKADENFPGYISNSKYMSTGISANIFRKINLSANYNFNYFNIALDTMYANAPFSNNLNFSASYRLNFNHSISIGVNKRGREDRRTPKQFNYNEYTARFTLQSKIKKFTINLNGSIGKTENFLQLNAGEVTNVLNGNLSLQYKISKSIFIKSFINYFEGKQYLINDFKRFLYGGTINLNFGKKLTLMFHYQNDYMIEEYYKDRSLLSLNTNYEINKKNIIGINANYNLRKNSLNNTQLNASLKYTYIINLAVSKREDIGSLQGKIINKGADNIEGISFTLAGNIAISDKNGEFEFPFVETGRHFLFMDNSKSGLNSIAEEPGPYIIEIMPGKKSNFEITLTKSGKITGNIIIEEDINNKKKGFISVKDELKKLIIEAKNKEETYRVLTKNNGTFTFDDLRPGNWKIKIYKRGIPKGYNLETNEFNINLNSMQVKHINVIIKKKSRRIKFQTKF